MPNFSRTERTIFTGAVVMLLLSSYFLYDDSLLFPHETRSQNELIGDVSSSQNDVRRKNSDAFSWYPATKKDSVFQSDSIFTGDGSNASIRLKDGSVIEIQPNSLVTLNVKDGQMTLDLRYGNLVGEVSKNSAVVIKSGGEEFKLQGDKSKVEFKKDRNGSMGVKLLAGNANVTNKSGKSLGLSPQGVSVAANGEVKVQEKIEVNLDTPSGTHILKTKKEDPVRLNWSSKGRIAKYELEVAKDENFTEMIATNTTKEKLAALQQDLPPGTYAWRIKAYDFSGKVAKITPPNTFTIFNYTAPQITSPAAAAVLSQEIRANNHGLTGETKITWDGDANYKEFHFQVARDPDFKDLVKNIDTPLRESLSSALPSGTYYTRVQAKIIDKGAFSPWSPTVPFTLQFTARARTLPAPILVSNDIKFKAPTERRGPASLASPSVEWKPVTEAKAYKLQIAKDKTFAQAQTFDVTKTQMHWSQYRPGKYYYRVYSVGEDNEHSGPSNIGEMLINSDTPQLQPIPAIAKRAEKGDYSLAPSQEIALSWSEVPFAKAYAVEVDTSERFAKPLQFEFPTPSAIVKLPAPGHYHVRVKALDDKSKALSDYSNQQDAIYKFTSSLAPPAPSEPFNKASIFLQQESTPFIWLEWKSVSGAKTYRIEVSSTPNFSNKIVSQVTTDRRFLIKNRIPSGKIFWRVRAENSEQAAESDWSSEREFMIYHQKNETFIK